VSEPLYKEEVSPQPADRQVGFPSYCFEVPGHSLFPTAEVEADYGVEGWPEVSMVASFVDRYGVGPAEGGLKP
jgi:hypothetical protein